MPGRFKDYIAMPKSNMYQSLHTTVRRARRASRSRSRSAPSEMHRTRRVRHRRALALQGAAASGDEAADLAWLGQMLEWLKDMADPREFMEGLKIDLYGGQVFVFTPKGDVMNLPAGATPVDFAYAIHTEVGHRTIGAKVSGRLVPLDYELRTGDAVEILTSKARARVRRRTGCSSSRRRELGTRSASGSRASDARTRWTQGRDALQRVMRRQNVPFKRLATEEALRGLADEMKFPDLDSLYAAMGEGHVSPQSVVARLTRMVSGTPAGRRHRGTARRARSASSRRTSIRRGRAGLPRTCG